jgi:hypothetical protein
VNDPKTEVMMVPGFACALCSDTGSPAVHVPVMTPEGQPRLPRICQHCLSSLLGVVFQLAGHAHEQVSLAVVSVSATGHPS